MATKQEKAEKIELQYAEMKENPEKYFWKKVPPAVMVNGTRQRITAPSATVDLMRKRGFEVTVDNYEQYINNEEFLKNQIRFIAGQKIDKNENPIEYEGECEGLLSTFDAYYRAPLKWQAENVGTVNKWKAQLDQEKQEKIDKLEDDIEGPSVPVGQNFLSGQTTSAFAGSAALSEEEKNSPPQTTPPQEDISSSAGANSQYATQNNQSAFTSQLTGVFNASGIAAGASAVTEAVDTIQNVAANVKNQLRNGAMKATTQVMGTGGQLVGTAVGTVSNVLGDMNQIKDLTTLAIQDITSYATQTLTGVITDLITPPVGLIASYTSTYLAELMSQMPNEVLNMVSKANELMQLSTVGDIANGAVNGFMGAVNENIGKVTDRISYFSNTVMSEMDQINQYALAGTTWVTKKIDKIKGDAKTNISYYINKEAGKLIEKRNQFAYNAGHTAAWAAFQPIMKANLNSMQDKLNKIEQAKAKAETKAKTAVQGALLKVLGKIGG